MRFNGKIFDRFKNTTVHILREDGYDDYENKYTFKEIGSIEGDLQPFSGELLEKTYGLKKECQKRFFCTDCAFIDTGVYMKINDVLYVVIYAERWGMGMDIMLKEVKRNG